MHIKNLILFLRRNLEAFFWIGAIVALAFTSPVDACHSLCPLSNLGFEWCPGCGLGHSISWLFRGDLIRSFNTHPLGIPAVIILTIRTVNILRRNYRYNKYSYHKTIQHG
ncbi:MAG TPA: DUF2752 domain-containing protein [Bacteroidales bacterium]|nr:DUF2752 domain-containing protein [Bacteroidales bacterium]